MRATITTAIKAVYHHFHCRFCWDGGGVGVIDGVVVTGAEAPPPDPTKAVGTLIAAAAAWPPEVDTGFDGHEAEVDEGSCGVAYTGATEPGLLVAGNDAGAECASDGEEVEGVKLIPACETGAPM